MYCTARLSPEQRAGLHIRSHGRNTVTTASRNPGSRADIAHLLNNEWMNGWMNEMYYWLFYSSVLKIFVAHILRADYNYFEMYFD